MSQPTISLLTENTEDVDQVSVDWRELADLTAGLAGKFALEPLLDHILRYALQSLQCAAGSIATVDEQSKTYSKMIDIGVACRAGKTFPLDQGVSGAVFETRGPVTFDSYNEVRNGHLEAKDRATIQGVIGVPILWNDSIIGTLTVFGQDPDRRFGRRDSEFLEIIAAYAAVGLTNSYLHAKATERASTIAVTAERERLYRELSDTAARELATLQMHLNSIHRTLGNPAKLAEVVKRAQDSAGRTWREVLRVASTPATTIVDDKSLVERIGLELVWLESRHQLRTDLIVSGEPFPLSRNVSHHVFRMIQQALANIVQHAGGTLARVGLVYGTDKLTVIVADDGCGFDAEAWSNANSPNDPHGRGLAELMARANQFGGSVFINATPGWGVRLEFTIPREGDASTSTRVRVLVAHQQSIVRTGVVEMLGFNEPGIQVVGEATTAEEALDAYKLLEPDVVVGGFERPIAQGNELISMLRDHDADAAVVMLTDSTCDDQVRMAGQMGVRGLVGRDVDPAGLTNAVLAAARGDTMVAGDLLRNVDDGMVDLGSVTQTTAREREVRALITQGHANKQIATMLGISVKTVEKHVGTLLKKTGARNRTMLASLPVVDGRL